MSLPPTTCLADVLQLRGETGWLSPPLRPMVIAPPVLGTARTVRLAAGPGGLGPLRDLLTEDLSGRVIVIADARHAAGGVWGEILSLAAQGRGAAGVLVDGAVRDLAALGRIGLQVWAGDQATAGPGADVHVAEIGGPVTIGSASLADGDPVLLDAEGAVALPSRTAPDVLAAATAYARAEEEVTAELLAGRDLSEAYRHKASVVQRISRPPRS